MTQVNLRTFSAICRNGCWCNIFTGEPTANCQVLGTETAAFFKTNPTFTFEVSPFPLAGAVARAAAVEIRPGVVLVVGGKLTDQVSNPDFPIPYVSIKDSRLIQVLEHSVDGPSLPRPRISRPRYHIALAVTTLEGDGKVVSIEFLCHELNMLQ